MIPNQELRELASFWTEHSDAISFYSAPGTPSELSHREEAILAKEKIQQLFGSLTGSSVSVRADIARLLEVTAAMKGNHAQGRVIFACAREKIWREYDLPAVFPTTLDAARNFMLAPLCNLLQPAKRYCIAMADRNRSRLFILESGKIQEHSEALDEGLDPELDKIRTTGTGGSTHVERQREEMVRQHFQFVASRLLQFYERRDFDALLIGCRDAMWPEIEGALHSQLKRVLMGHFRIDPGLATAELAQQCAEELIQEANRKEERALMQAAEEGAAANALGAVGLPSVIRSLERGEVRTLLWRSNGRADSQMISVCPNCGHLRLGEARVCDLCSRPMRQFARAEEALVRLALTQGLEMRLVDSVMLPAAEEFAAVLRFRSDHNTLRSSQVGQRNL
jgi:peptide subunit release factor 1 (eRF1)